MDDSPLTRPWTAARRRPRRLRLPALLCSLLLLAACSGLQTVEPITAGSGKDRTADSEDPRWRYLRFRLARAEDGSVNSYLDLLLAEQLLAPVVDTHAAQIPLWRFHRRWPEDATGHMFSFIFFAGDGVAEKVRARVEGDPLLGRLEREGHLVEYRTHLADAAHAGDVAATSDRQWPQAIQREWPHFIMGASRMWLGLLRTESARHANLDLHARYRATEAALDAVWLTKGNHAFLHHLSALFGYKPVRVIRRDIMTF